MRTRTLLWLALVPSFAAAATPARGQDPDRGPQAGPVLGLSLAEALSIALERDIALRVQALAGEVARHGYEGSWGVFDPVLRSEASYAEEESQPFSTLQSAAVIEETDWRIDSSLLYPLTTGGDVTLRYLLAETESNSQLVQSSARATTDIIALTFRQPLLRGAGGEYSLSQQREARLVFERELATLRETELDLLRNVEDAYWDLVAARSQLAVARESLALSEEQLDQNQRRLEAGVGTEVEVVQSRADLATRREELLAREVAVRDAGDVLKTRLFPGTDLVQWSTTIEPSTELPAIRTDDLPTWQQAVAIALAERPDLARARLDIEAAEERLVRAQNEQRAQLDLSLSTSSRGFDTSRSEAFETAAGWDFPTHTAALSFSYPIGNRAAEGAERGARAELRQARLLHDGLQSDVVFEIRTASRAVQYEAEAVAAAETSVELARRQLEAEEARFREGLSTNFQVLEFQEDLTAAQFALVQTRAAFAKARTALGRAQGTLAAVPMEAVGGARSSATEESGAPR